MPAADADDPDDPDAALVEHARALADAIDAALPAWVERCVRSRLSTMTRPIREATAAAGRDAVADVGAAVRRLVLADVDDQRGNPLALLRTATVYPTSVLHEAGAPVVERDKFSRERFPDDDYDLTPATWADLDPGLQELGITWGAAKAFVHKARHRPTSDGR
jgi:hypothetical protein